MSSPAIKDGVVLIGSSNGKLYAFDQTPPPPKLTVVKQVINNDGGTKQVSDFPLFVDDTQVLSGQTNQFSAGNYVVSESNSNEYIGTFSGDCDPQGNVSLAIGDNKECIITNDDLPFLSDLSPAEVWIGLENNNDAGIRFDLKAEVYKDGNLVGNGVLDSVDGGGSGFNNAILYSIPLSLDSPILFNPGDNLSIAIFARNACLGSSKNSGKTRLWYNDAAANTHFDATIGGVTNDYFFLTEYKLLNSLGPGPKATIDVRVGQKCGSYVTFGTWAINPRQYPPIQP
jgi:hypothetical protein